MKQSESSCAWLSDQKYVFYSVDIIWNGFAKVVAVNISITDRRTKAQISLRFLSNADLISGSPEAPVPSVLGQVDHITCLSFRVFFLVYCRFTAYPCLTILKYRKDVLKCHEYEVFQIF